MTRNTKPGWWHEECLQPYLCYANEWSNQWATDVRAIPDTDVECDSDGWEHVCEGCGLPSPAAQWADYLNAVEAVGPRVAARLKPVVPRPNLKGESK